MHLDVYASLLLEGEDMPIISFINFKGGVTKTSSNVGLGAALARNNFKVLLVDCDPQGHIGVHLGLNIEAENKKGIQDILGQRGRSVSEIVIERSNNLFIAPSGRGLGLARSELANRANRDALLFRALREIRSDYDFILIDTPPDEGLLSINAMYASDYIIIPTTLDSFSLHGFNPLMRAIYDMQDAYDERSLSILGILINRYDERLKTQNRKNMEALCEAFSENSLIFETKVRTDEEIRKAQDDGVTIFEKNKRSKGAKDFDQFSIELAEKLNKAQMHQAVYAS